MGDCLSVGDGGPGGSSVGDIGPYGLSVQVRGPYHLSVGNGSSVHQWEMEHIVHQGEIEGCIVHQWEMDPSVHLWERAKCFIASGMSIHMRQTKP